MKIRDLTIEPYFLNIADYLYQYIMDEATFEMPNDDGAWESYADNGADPISVDFCVGALDDDLPSEHFESDQQYLDVCFIQPSARSILKALNNFREVKLLNGPLMCLGGEKVSVYGGVPVKISLNVRNQTSPNDSKKDVPHLYVQFLVMFRFRGEIVPLNVLQATSKAMAEEGATELSGESFWSADLTDALGLDEEEDEDAHS